jgi:hypothetical protein
VWRRSPQIARIPDIQFQVWQNPAAREANTGFPPLDECRFGGPCACLPCGHLMVCWLVCKVDVACIAEFVLKDFKLGTTPYPNGDSASAPRAGRNGRGQHPATRNAGGSASADRERCTSPETDSHEPTGTASSATEAPTKKTISYHYTSSEWFCVANCTCCHHVRKFNHCNS